VSLEPFLPTLLALGLSPGLFSVIQKTKAFFAGRQGPPWLQPYYDLWKLMAKGTVYSTTASPFIRFVPWGMTVATAMCLPLLPFGPWGAPAAFSGDLILLVFLLVLARFLLVLGALETGSSFEGMGASREVILSALAEPVYLLSLCAMVRLSGTASLSEMAAGPAASAWRSNGPALILVGMALFTVLLSENARIPVDDPNTHLELTMIHEVMILDAGGPDLALFQYVSGLKLWIHSTVLVGLLSPWGGSAGIRGAFIQLALVAALSVVVGVVESVMARLRMNKVPTLLSGAGVLAVTALILVMR
jgi:formate hydrogenlyase subunit 4